MSTSRIKILLAEDARTMRKIEMKSLNDLGYNDIVEANDGQEAMELMDDTIDLIISDWNMPNKSGFEFLEWIRASEDFKDAPFIMATAQSDKDYIDKAERAGVTGFISKPFADDELKRTINRIFSADQVEEEPPAYGEITADGRVVIKVAHIQITDHLILGVLKDMIDTGELSPEFFALETECLAGWNSVYNDLESGKANAACVLAPIAMDLYNTGTPVKIILLAHRGGSIVVKSCHTGRDDDSGFYKGTSFLIPHKLSVHHMLTDIMFKGLGLNSSLDKGDRYDIELEVVPPVHMSEFLTNNSNNSGFMVAEPIGSKAISQGIASLECYTNQIWENHPCCVFTIRDDFIEHEPEAVQEFTEMLVKAGRVIENDPERAAEVGKRFLDPDGELGLTEEVLKKIITDENGIKTDDLYPNTFELNMMQDYMVEKMGVGSKVDLENFVDLSFADKACEGLERKNSTLRADEVYIKELFGFKEEVINFPIDDDEMEAETELPSEEEPIETKEVKDKKEEVINKPVDVEVKPVSIEENKALQEDIADIGGKFLTFSLANQEYGIDILKIKEIIGMMKINTLPQLPDHIKGVINLRDSVIPVMDLRQRFGMEELEYNERTCIIIIEVKINDEVKNIGIVVDSVSEVLPIDSSEVEEPPDFNFDIETNFILAMAKKQDSVKTLLNIENVIR